MILTNARILTFDAANRVILSGSVEVRADGKFGAVSDKEPTGNSGKIDAGGRLLMPALINCHTHLYSTLARGIALGGTPPADFLSIYAQHFDTVEVDSTYYRIPSESLVRNWRARTPPGFAFAAKFPQVISHEKVLQNCKEEVANFLRTMSLLEDRRGPLLLQFPYFNKKAFARPGDFLDRLAPFLETLSAEFRYAVEVRNKTWVTPRLLEILRGKNMALALIDHPWMTPVQQLMSKQDVVTADFAYIRWLGDRKGIEEKTQHWDKVIIDRENEMEIWVAIIRELLKRRIQIMGYFNNHYAGFAPGSIELLGKVWERRKDL